MKNILMTAAATMMLAFITTTPAHADHGRTRIVIGYPQYVPPRPAPVWYADYPPPYYYYGPAPRYYNPYGFSFIYDNGRNRDWHHDRRDWDGRRDRDWDHDGRGRRGDRH